MDLVYLWVDSYGGIFKDSGFHFSNEFQFNYDAGTLNVWDSPHSGVPKGFFGENCTNVSVVVGDNGAGKTSLLKAIMDCLAIEEDGIDLSFAAAFFDQDNRVLYVYGTSPLELNSECKDVDVKILSKKCLSERMDKTKLIYMNNVLDLNDYSRKKRGDVFDGSIGGLMRIDYHHNLGNRHITNEANPIYHYFNNEVYRQVDFLLSIDKFTPRIELPFPTPRVLGMSIVASDNSIKQTEEQLIRDIQRRYGDGNNSSDMHFEQHRIRFLLNVVHDSKRGPELTELDWWFSLIAEHLVINAIKEVAESNTTSDNRTKELYCLLDAYETYLDGEIPMFQYCSLFLERAFQKLKEQGSIYADRIIPYRNFIEWIEDNKGVLESEITVGGTPSLAYLQMDVHGKDTEKRFKEFFEHYNRTCRPHYFLNFSWGLSTGENNFLSLFARLHSVLKTDPEGGRSRELVKHTSFGEVECDKVVLLIDEADLSYHPRWQMEYVSALLKALSALYVQYKIQLILTTHSPILLSDIPHSQVIYLREGKIHKNTVHKETFGQNIYTLFQDAFFLDKTAGELSQRIITEVNMEMEKQLIELNSSSVALLNLNNHETDKKFEYFEYVIGIIGEPIIRNVLESKYHQLKTAYRSKDLQELIDRYNELSNEDKNKLIDHIIRTSDKGQ